jgi:hypothetical protein
MQLRTRLYLIVVASFAPIGLAALAATLLLIEQGRDSAAREAVGRARGAMSAVDAHLRGSIAALETLATFKGLEKGDIAAFHAESQRVLRTQPSWVNVGLSKADKTVLSNAVYVLGQPEPPISVDAPSFEAVVRTARPSVGSVAVGPVVRGQTVRVRVPVSYGEEVRYVVSAPLSLKYLAGLLEAQHVPGSWAISLVDREMRVIARIPALPAGVEESEALRDTLERGPEGWFKGRTREGRDAYTAYTTSELSGWMLAISVPAAAVDALSRRVFTILVAGAALALAIGTALAEHTAKRFSA